jgi:hypothetical protein
MFIFIDPCKGGDLFCHYNGHFYYHVVSESKIALNKSAFILLSDKKLTSITST